MYIFGQFEHSRWVRMLPQSTIFEQALKLFCLSANYNALCSLLTKQQSQKKQAIQRLRNVYQIFNA